MVRNILSHQGANIRKMNLHNSWLWKWEWPNLTGCYNQQDLKPGILKISWLRSSGRSLRVLGNWISTLKEIAWQMPSRNTAREQQFEKNARGRLEGEWFTHLRAFPREARITGRHFEKQRSWHVPFLSTIPPHMGTSTTPTLATQLAYTKPATHNSTESPFPVTLSSLPALWYPFSRRPAQIPPMPHFLICAFCGTSVIEELAGLIFQADWHTLC